MRYGWIAGAALLLGCASVSKHDPLYDGDLIPVTPSSDSATFVRLKITNDRTIDATPPHIYLKGTGQHSLGVLVGMGGKIDRLVDTAWFGQDGCFLIVAHYVGLGDLTFSKICWHPGERVEATLRDRWDPNTAWSHR